MTVWSAKIRTFLRKGNELLPTIYLKYLIILNTIHKKSVMLAIELLAVCLVATSCWKSTYFLCDWLNFQKWFKNLSSLSF